MFLQLATARDDPANPLVYHLAHIYLAPFKSAETFLRRQLVVCRSNKHLFLFLNLFHQVLTDVGPLQI
jgi:hypothetical protein